jgi:cytochrome oxidase Cu insertion factor (SCO1/SenC/PrrC family)
MRRSIMLMLGFALPVLLAVAVFVGGCGGGDAADAGDSGSPSGSASRSAAADFAGATIDGEQVSLESYEGKPLALIFWATW